MVREVLTNDEGKATGVSYINKDDRKEYSIKGKIVILAASACSSAQNTTQFKIIQILQWAGQRQWHDWQVPYTTLPELVRGAILPALFDRKTYNEDGTGGMHVYTPLVVG